METVPDWMNWGVWRWISLLITACVFFWLGRSVQATIERGRNWVRERRVDELTLALRPFAEAAAVYDDETDFDAPSHGRGRVLRRHLIEAHKALNAAKTRHGVG